MTKRDQLKIALGVFAAIVIVIGGGTWLASCEDDADSDCIEYRVRVWNQPILTGKMIQVVPIQVRRFNMRLKLFALLLFLPSFSNAADANLMISIIECESSGRFNAVGDGGLSHGIAQFRRDTFYEFASLAKMKGMRWKNPIHQMRVMNWALDNGYGRRWTCYRKLTKTGEFKAS